MTEKTLQERLREIHWEEDDVTSMGCEAADHLDALETNIEGYRKRISALEAKNTELESIAENHFSSLMVTIDRAEAAEAQLAEAREALLIADKAIDSLLGQEAFVSHWDYLRRVREKIRATPLEDSQYGKE